MGRIRGKKPSPAMIVAVVSLIFAVAGTSIAGVATISVLNKKEKKQTRSIAKDEISKAAPGLSVGNAASAQNANAVGGIPPSQIGAVGRTNFESFCLDLDHDEEDCTSVQISLPRIARVLVVASSNYFSNLLDDPVGPGSGVDNTNMAVGGCRIAVDGIAVGALVVTGVEGTGVGDEKQLALNRVSFPLDPGTHTFSMRCAETDGMLTWGEPSISAVMLGSD